MDTSEDILDEIKKIYGSYSSKELFLFDNLFDNLEDVSYAEIANYIIDLEKHYKLKSLKDIFNQNISFTNLAQLIFKEKYNGVEF